MKVGRQFNTLTLGEYLHLIANHKKFSDFNTLGLFRSIVESTKLTLEEQLAVRQAAITAFAKAFNFLQLKDPDTFIKVKTLGETLTKADEKQVWEEVKRNQQLIWESKKPGHRSFGTYSKHNCGYDTCPYNGIMVRQGTWLAEGELHFNSDSHCRWSKLNKALQHRKDRKSAHRTTAQRILDE